MEAISTIIARADGRNKIIDFRDNLSLSDIKEYAMLHSAGGSKRGFKSTIKVVLCDYSAGTGNSVTVSANLEVDRIYHLMEAAKKALLSGGSTPAASVKEIQSSITNAGTILRKVQGQEAKTAVDKLLAAYKLVNNLESVESLDFSYKQDRVDVYRKNNGSAPVTILSISRTDKDRNGNKMRSPWCVKITNGTAPLKEQQNGTSSYVNSQLKVEKECFINLSDYDMFRCLNRVVRFIEIWENTMGIPVVAQGEKLREQARLDAINSKS